MIHLILQSSSSSSSFSSAYANLWVMHQGMEFYNPSNMSTFDYENAPGTYLYSSMDGVARPYRPAYPAAVQDIPYVTGEEEYAEAGQGESFFPSRKPSFSN